MKDKIVFRKYCITLITRAIPSPSVLCLYGGGDMEVTALYRNIASRVVAVDTQFKVKLAGVECVQSRVEDFEITDEYDIVDIDPFGSCLVALKRVLSTCRKAKAIVLTDGYAVKKRKHKDDVIETLKAGGFRVVGETTNEQNTAIHIFAIKD